MHKTLLRQIGHHIQDANAIPAAWQALLEAVSKTYEGFDQDRLLIERSLEVSSNELKGLIALLQATLDSTSEGILVINARGQMANYNKRFLEIWKIPEEIMRTHDTQKAINAVADQMEDPTTFKQHIIGVLNNDSEERSLVVRFIDGRTVEMNSKPHIVDNKSIGRVWSFRDITKHLTVENELKTKLDALERLNKAMVDREIKMVELKRRIAQLEERQS